ncbi:hypothetical protein PGT21_012696 [Puccinia graminis f. sp. tritici]|uniref:Uncharacterized protein n=1 Tax=Puccinia graminis f. sp. tritici TaxID=56615 RepID=A0A5B0LN96_PUCGR|nr:hypothetical protein PGT21_012696 [Puccinia graminis f. sp. tritici]KAA1104934.1 hypothetical protein PGTUg99_000681 [Puccinia graminis f. sp. tritici]
MRPNESHTQRIIQMHWYIGQLEGSRQTSTFLAKPISLIGLCHKSPLLPLSSAPNSTLPHYPTLKLPPASHNVLRCHSLGLRLSPLRRLSVQVLLRPLMDRSPTAAPNPTSAPRCSPLLVAPTQYTLNPRSAVGREPWCPPVPGFPAASFSEPCAFRF